MVGQTQLATPFGDGGCEAICAPTVLHVSPAQQALQALHSAIMLCQKASDVLFNADESCEISKGKGQISGWREGICTGMAIQPLP